MAAQFINFDHSDPATSVRISQKAPSTLSKSSLVPKPLPLSIVSAAESPEEWAEVEQIFYACLRTGDDKTAYECLQKITNRFGHDNQRVMAMKGIYQEAQAKDELDLRKILQEYNKIIDNDAMNVAMHKRRVGLIKSVGRPIDAIECLVTFLGTFPNDTEAWCELSDLYQSQGMSAQAIFSLEEALLSAPNAWNLHARLGELNYLAAQSNQEGNAAVQKYLAEAIRRFARSVELCEDYLRGYYGLKLATNKLSSAAGNSDTTGLSLDTVRELNTMATTRLKDIVQRHSAKASGTREAELIAAKALLDDSSS